MNNKKLHEIKLDNGHIFYVRIDLISMVNVDSKTFWIGSDLFRMADDTDVYHLIDLIEGICG